MSDKPLLDVGVAMPSLRLPMLACFPLFLLGLVAVGTRAGYLRIANILDALHPEARALFEHVIAGVASPSMMLLIVGAFGYVLASRPNSPPMPSSARFARAINYLRTRSASWFTHFYVGACAMAYLAGSLWWELIEQGAARGHWQIHQSLADIAGVASWLALMLWLVRRNGAPDETASVTG